MHRLKSERGHADKDGKGGGRLSTKSATESELREGFNEARESISGMHRNLGRLELNLTRERLRRAEAEAKLRRADEEQASAEGRHCTWEMSQVVDEPQEQVKAVGRIQMEVNLIRRK